MTVSKRHPPFNAGGFTLIEIMVSIVVLAMVLVTLFRLQSSTIKLAGSSQFYSVAPFLARQQLTALEPIVEKNETLSGDFGDTFPGYGWSCQVEKADFEGVSLISEQQSENILGIHLKINSPDKKKVYQITTWRYRVEKQAP